jgi:nicotinamide riboside transporter PnuC
MKNIKIEIIKWVACVFSFLGILLNTQKIIWCWPMWMLGSLLWIIIHYKKDYPQFIVWSLFFLANIYGWIEWAKM